MATWPQPASSWLYRCPAAEAPDVRTARVELADGRARTAGLVVVVDFGSIPPRSAARSAAVRPATRARLPSVTGGIATRWGWNAPGEPDPRSPPAARAPAGQPRIARAN